MNWLNVRHSRLADTKWGFYSLCMQSVEDSLDSPGKGALDLGVSASTYEAGPHRTSEEKCENWCFGTDVLWPFSVLEWSVANLVPLLVQF